MGRELSHRRVRDERVAVAQQFHQAGTVCHRSQAADRGDGDGRVRVGATGEEWASVTAARRERRHRHFQQVRIRFGARERRQVKLDGVDRHERVQGGRSNADVAVFLKLAYERRASRSIRS